MIELDRFCKCYGTETAVDNLSFSVQAGEVLGLIGRNGAGKTTTLRALTGIIPATSGSIRVDGFDIDTDPMKVKQRTAYVPDDPQLFHDLTVEQHLAFTASVYRVDDPGPRIDALLEMFELTGKRHSPASGLSRGMRQKLAICCAYVHQPQALLLDEPMTGLDPPAIRHLKRSIVENAQRGAAVIISSHLLAMVEDICTHLLIIDQGQAKFYGTLEEVKTRFASSSDSPDDELSSLENIFFAAIECQTELASERSSSEPAVAVPLATSTTL